jgi:hypothetical protein
MRGMTRALRPEVPFGRVRRKWLGRTLMLLVPFIGAGLYFFHVIVYTGAAGGCGGV